MESHLGAGFTNIWLAVGLITSGIGPLGAALLADRIGRLLPLGCATGLAVLTLPLLVGEVTHLNYAVVLTLLPLGYYFAITYMFSIVAEADHNGRMAGQMSFALAVGAGTGPALFGVIKSANGNVVLGMGVLIALGAGLMLWIQARLQTRANAKLDGAMP